MIFQCSWKTIYCSQIDHFESVGIRMSVWQNKYFDHFEKWDDQNSQNEFKQTGSLFQSLRWLITASCWFHLGFYSLITQNTVLHDPSFRFSSTSSFSCCGDWVGCSAACYCIDVSDLNKGSCKFQSQTFFLFSL